MACVDDGPIEGLIEEGHRRGNDDRLFFLFEHDHAAKRAADGDALAVDPKRVEGEGDIALLPR